MPRRGNRSARNALSKGPNPADLIGKALAFGASQAATRGRGRVGAAVANIAQAAAGRGRRGKANGGGDGPPESGTIPVGPPAGSGGGRAGNPNAVYRGNTIKPPAGMKWVPGHSYDDAVRAGLAGKPLPTLQVQDQKGRVAQWQGTSFYNAGTGPRPQPGSTTTDYHPLTGHHTAVTGQNTTFGNLPSISGSGSFVAVPSSSYGFTTTPKPNVNPNPPAPAPPAPNPGPNPAPAPNPAAARGPVATQYATNFTKGPMSISAMTKTRHPLTGKMGYGIRFTNEEMVTSISGTTSLTVLSRNVNPSDPSTCPMAAPISSNFDLAAVESWGFMFKTEEASAIKGKFNAAYDYNVTDAAPTSRQQLSDLHRAQSAQVFRDAAVWFEKKMAYNNVIFLQNSGQANSNDPRLNSPAVGYLATSDCTNTTTGNPETSTIGDIWVKYTILLWAENLESFNSTYGMGIWQGVNVSSASMGNMSPATGSSSQFTLTNNLLVATINLPNSTNINGQYVTPPASYLVTWMGNYTATATAVNVTLAGDVAYHTVSSQNDVTSIVNTGATAVAGSLRVDTTGLPNATKPTIALDFGATGTAKATGVCQITIQKLATTVGFSNTVTVCKPAAPAADGSLKVCATTTTVNGRACVSYNPGLGVWLSGRHDEAALRAAARNTTYHACTTTTSTQMLDVATSAPSAAAVVAALTTSGTTAPVSAAPPSAPPATAAAAAPPGDQLRMLEQKDGWVRLATR